jgi:hypothetical protein
VSSADGPISKRPAPARPRFWDISSRNWGKNPSSDRELVEMLQKIPTFLSVWASRRTICTQRKRRRLSTAATRPSGSATVRNSAGMSTRPLSSLRRV